MATTSTAATQWNGNLFDGSGSTSLVSSGVASFPVAWQARAEAGPGTTNPEELLAAAHATCYSMALSNKLDQAGFPPESLEVTAQVTFQPGEGITGIALKLSAIVPGMSSEDVLENAMWAKDNCPVSQALKAVPITLEVDESN